MFHGPQWKLLTATVKQILLFIYPTEIERCAAFSCYEVVMFMV